MAIGYFIGEGDKTSCGGRVLEGEKGMMFGNVRRAVEGHRVSCGEDGETYHIIGGVSGFLIEGRRAAGSLDSTSTCPCKASLIPSSMFFTYQHGAKPNGRAGAPATASSNSPPGAQNLASRGSSARGPGVPTTPVFSGTDQAEPGFYLVPKSTTRAEIKTTLFPSPNAALLEKFHSLNPGSDLVKASTMIVLSDPSKQRLVPLVRPQQQQWAGPSVLASEQELL